MSVGGPTSPSALLVQRLEAALGTSLSQTNLHPGSRADAVAQPGQSDRQHATQNDAQRTGQERVDRQRVQTDQAARRDVSDTRSARQAALQGGELQTGSTSSAPTRLGQAARLILALLMHMPERAPAAVGRQPLLPSAPQPGGAGGHAAATAIGGSGRDAVQQPAGTDAAPGDTQEPEATGVQRQRPAGAATDAASRGAEGPASGPRGGEAMRAQSLQSLVQQGLMAGQLARALGQTVQTSGLFYESHLQDWVFGARTREQLMQEPQAMLGGRASAGQPAAGAAASGGASGAAAQAAAQPAASGMPVAPAVVATAAAPPAAPLSLPGIDNQAQSLVRQQLEVLANQTFHWRGEVWPGAPMDWEIRRREGQQPAPGQPAEEPDHWSTTLRLQLGRLGDVYARLSMAGGDVVLHLAAPQAAPALQEALHGLRERFQGHALSLVQVSVTEQWPAASDEAAA